MIFPLGSRMSSCINQYLLLACGSGCYSAWCCCKSCLWRSSSGTFAFFPLFLSIINSCTLVLNSLAHAYVRSYFLTIHYDPFIGTFSDPVRSGNVPFVSTSVIPASWARFTPAAVSRWTRPFGTPFSSAAYHSSYAGRALKVLNSTRVAEWEWLAKWTAILPTVFIQDVQEGARVWPPS